MALDKGQVLSGFTVEDVEALPLVDCTAHLLRHYSGALLMYMESPDPEKVFSVAFRTLPTDDTGVFHILEHSVLCGSRRYPVKEPFTHLKKASMRTFLNAMTCPDQTLFPVATTNEKDLFNLVDVYLDAVWHPLLVSDEDILAQEGWHYEESQGRLVTSGVVYNEMKGALGSSVRALLSSLNKQLFPGSFASWVSGGDPAHICELDQEAFVDAWRRHYRLDNCLMYLYGSMDIEKTLRHIEQEHLREAAREQAGRVGAPNPLTAPQPVTLPFSTVERDVTADQQCIGVGFRMAFDPQQPWKTLAADILCTALLGNLESPLSRMLVDTGISPLVVGEVSSSWLAPRWLVLGLAADVSRAHEFQDALVQGALRFAEEGVPRKELDAAIDALEFRIREHSSDSLPKGLQFYFDASEGWLSGNDWLGMLRYDEALAFLRNPGSDSYYEDLLREILIDNKERALCLVKAVPGRDAFGEEERMGLLERQTDAAGREEIRLRAQALKQRRGQADSPQAQASLPRLSLSDLNDAPPAPKVSIRRCQGVECLFLDEPTNDICYLILNYDLGFFHQDTVQDLALLASLLDMLPTRRHTAQELQTLKAALTAEGFGFDISFNNLDGDPNQVQAVFKVYAKCLSRNIEATTALIREVLTECDFGAVDKILEVVDRLASALTNALAQGDPLCAHDRAFAQLRAKSALDDATGGFPFLEYLTALASQAAGDSEFAQGLNRRFADLLNQVLSQPPLLASFAGPNEAWQAFVNAGGLVCGDPHCIPQPNSQPLSKAKPLGPRREAFVVNAGVSCLFQVFDLRETGLDFDASLKPAANLIDDELLWNEIRVKGGAYTVGSGWTRSGIFFMNTARDPKPQRSLGVFSSAPDWLEDYCPEDTLFEGHLISSVATLDKPTTPKAKLRLANTCQLIGRPHDDKLKIRQGLLQASPQGLKTVAKALETADTQGFSGCCALVPANQAHALEGFIVHDPLGLLNENGGQSL